MSSSRLMRTYLNPYKYLFRAHNVIDRAVDRIKGVDFANFDHPPENIGLDPSESYRCVPSGNLFLAKAIQKIDIKPQDRLLDIGCGKGSAMNTLMKFPFSVVHGLEISDFLATKARNNFEKLGKETVIFNQDALEFANYGDYNFFYMFNPFPPHIMEQVVDRIHEQTAATGETVTIIYNLPESHDAVVKSGAFQLSETDLSSIEGRGINLYSNRAPS